MIVVALLVERERVLEAGAAAALDADAETHVALGGLTCHELLHLLRSDVGELDHLPPNCIGEAVGTLKDSMPSAEELRTRIEDALPGADVNVIDTTGGGDHFRAEIVSERFEGLTRIQQHKLIYDVFGDEVGGAIHALSIKTGTPSPAGDGR